MLLLLDNYDSFTYNLAQYLGELGQAVKVVRNDEIDIAGIRDLSPRRIVISPGPCTPNEAGISVEIVRELGGHIPILGICLGHQSIGAAFGASIVRAAKVMHGKISKIFHDETGLFHGVDNPFTATRYHSLVIDPATLPSELVVTAKTWDDEIMGIRHLGFAEAGVPLEGLQFHPESIMTPAGMSLLGNFLAMTRDSEPKEGAAYLG